MRSSLSAQAGWHLEEDEPGGEEGVRGKSLSIGESGVEAEELVDSQMNDAGSVSSTRSKFAKDHVRVDETTGLDAGTPETDMASRVRRRPRLGGLLNVHGRAA